MALLTKHDPFETLNPCNNLLEDEFFRLLPSRLVKENDHWHPVVDIIENKNAYTIKVELPEIDEKAIDMQIEKNVLTLKGERKMEERKEDDHYSRMERYYGRFVRTFRLPESVDTKGISAKLNQGVLKIRLPKKEETKPRNIKVEVK